jgi:hypothetical protein
MIAFRSRQVSQLATAATTIAVAVPAGVVAGDVLLTWTYFNVGGTLAVTRPAGWNLVRVDNVFQGSVGLYWRLADGTEPATYTWTLSTAARGIVAMNAYTGVSPTSPVGHLHVVKPTSGTTLPLPAKTAAVDNSWFATMAGAFGATDAGVTFVIDEATDAERSDNMTVGGTSGSRPAQAVYDTNATVARGSTHDRVVTMSTSSVANQSQVAWWTDLISDETTGTGPIAYRGAASGAGTWPSTTPTATISLDASYVVNGDLLVAAVTRNGGSVTPPAGFTRIQFTPTGGLEYSVWYKIAHNEPSTLGFVSAGTSGSRFVGVGMVAYSGANTSSPIGAWAFNQDVNPTPTITTRTAGSWILSAVFRSASVTSFSTTDALDIERVELTGGGTVATPIGMYDSAREYAAGSAVSRTLNGAGGGTGYLRFIAEIRPGIAVPSGPTVTFNHRETDLAWTERTGVPKAWTVGGEWVEAPGAHWDGTAWLDLPS